MSSYRLKQTIVCISFDVRTGHALNKFGSGDASSIADQEKAERGLLQAMFDTYGNTYRTQLGSK